MNAIAAASAERKVHVPLGERAYDILIGPGLIARAGAEIALRLKGRKAAVITDTNVASIYLDALVQSLEAAGIASATLVLRAGAEIALRLKGRKAAVITDTNVASIYLDALVQSLEAAGIASATLVLPA